MQTDRDIVASLAGLSLFADLARPELEAVAHSVDEEWFPEGQRILRQGFAGNNLYVILEGEAEILVGGTPRARLTRGDFFGEVSILLGEPPTADVVATTALRCAVVSGTEIRPFLIAHPQVLYRVLQAEARRLATTLEWLD
jgi:CRP/FNR family cyclic AMP-dependent transcriptional regulator